MRVRHFDGLRGIAALLVLIHHTLECYGGRIPDSIQASFLVLGQQSVWLFFVLSGVVLTLQWETSEMDFRDYLPRRLARLYLPTATAVTLTYISILLVPRHRSVGIAWIDMHPQAVSLNAILSDLTLFNGTSGNLMPLWSLKWEVLYSLLLVMIIFLTRRAPAWFLVLFWVIGSAGIGEVAMYGALFISGTIIGLKWMRWSEALRARPAICTSLSLVSLAMIALSNQLQARAGFAFSGNLSIFLGQMGIPILVACLPNSTLGFLADNKLARWLGKISFSLYLIHEPILIGVARLGHLAIVPIGIASLATIPAALFFYEVFEKRFHRFSRGLSLR